MRRALALVGGALVALGGAVAAVAAPVTFLADSVSVSDAAFVTTALAGAVSAVGAMVGFAAMRLPWNVKTGGVAAAALYLVGALTIFALIGFAIVPLAVVCVGAAAYAAGTPVRVAGLLLLASFPIYGIGAWILESVGKDGAYAVLGFAPVFALAWVALGYGIARVGLRPRPESASP